MNNPATKTGDVVHGLVVDGHHPVVRGVAVLLTLWAAVACGTGGDAGVTASQASATAGAPEMETSIVDVLEADGRFTTLVDLYRSREAPVPDREVSFYDILDDLDGRVWTVFAPTDAAFVALGDPQLRSLEEGPWLTSVLHRHMVPDLVRFEDLETGDLISDGGVVEVQVTGVRATYGGADIVHPDIEASNGVIHVIDGLVLPDHVRAEIGISHD